MTTKIKQQFIIIYLLLTISITTLGQGIDLAIAINGSSSISEEDFAIQKEGIKKALAKPEVVPRDGSIAFVLVQYAASTTRLHVPYTVIKSEVDVISIISKINEINQIKGKTNPGDGIMRAMEELNLKGNSNKKQVLCLSTDGIRNSGIDVQTAIQSAKNSIIGLDRFSVLAIEDPNNNVFADDFIDEYEGLVFGDGDVTVSINSIEYANLLGSTCLLSGDIEEISFELVGVEINQSIQSWENDIPLVSNKPTIVRFFVQTNSNNSSEFTAKLKGFRLTSSGDYVEFSNSSISAINASSFMAPPKTQLATDMIERRKNINSSLNFRLPSNWLTETIKIELDAIGNNIDFEDTLTFNESNVPKLNLVKVTHKDQMGVTHYVEDENVILELVNSLTSMYPITNTYYDITAFYYSKAIDLDDKNLTGQFFLDLLNKRTREGCDDYCKTIYHAFISGVDQGDNIGLAFFENVSVSKLKKSLINNTQNSYRSLFAHEIGHNFNLNHTGICPKEDDIATIVFPHNHLVDYGNSTFGPVATLGPVKPDYSNDKISDLMDQNWGYDFSTNKVIDPNCNFELMSYCEKKDTYYNWPSDVTYLNLREEINERFKLSPLNRLNSLNQKYLLVSGYINSDLQSVTFSPVSLLISDKVPLETQGQYSFEFLNKKNEIIEEIKFDPDFNFGFGLFNFCVLANPEIEKINLRFEDKNLGQLLSSENIPNVTVLYPNGNENLNEETIRFEWTSNDIDGDDLTYIVQYSQDGGSTWETLTVNWPDNFIDVFIEDLGETTQGKIRVIVSDGFNSSIDESDGVFITPNNVPNTQIQNPVNNSTYIGVEPIFFDGNSFDLEDGQLLGSNLEWSSNINGIIGSNETFNLIGSDLSEGMHTIILTATDNLGASTTDSVSIIISYLENSAPLLEILSPEDQSIFLVNDTLNLELLAEDIDMNDQINSVQIFLNSDNIITLNQPPFIYNQVLDQTGEFILTVIAKDTNSAEKSDSITFTVFNEFPNCNSADYSALKALYQSTNGNNWKRNEGWQLVAANNPAKDCNLSDLYGVNLDVNGRVSDINLYNNNLNGTLPPEIGELSELKALYLSAVNLVGEIPVELAKLSQLEYLFFVASGITGSIPPELGQLSNLKDLRLSYNQLSGEIPIELTNLPNLNYLSLGHNQLSGNIPPELANLNKLRWLSLSNNQLTGSIPAELAALTRLLLLTLYNNDLSGCYPSALNVLCDQLVNNFFGEEDDISSGNSLSNWENFCLVGEGDCNTLRLGDLNNFYLYPNPTTGNVFVQFENPGEQQKDINIYNIAGKKYFSKKVTSGKNVALNVQHLPKGIYMVEVNNGHNSKTQKLIIQ